MNDRTRNEAKRIQILRRTEDPGPARPITYLFVAVLSALFLAVGMGMVRHHFLTCEGTNYYSEYVSTPWHFEASISPLR
jgi:uncharacterized membrane-anchored protein YitT (DUF2179 family)